jgi:hypothetical protein
VSGSIIALDANRQGGLHYSVPECSISKMGFLMDVQKPETELLLYQTEDGRSCVQVRLEGETVWMTQRLMAELFQVSVPTINEHLKNIFQEGELVEEGTIRKFLIVQVEGKREVTARRITTISKPFWRLVTGFAPIGGRSSESGLRNDCGNTWSKGLSWMTSG